MQIHADVSSVPLILTESSGRPRPWIRHPGRGGADVFYGIEEAAAAMVKVARRIELNLAVHEAYRPSFEAYQRAYPSLKSIRPERPRITLL